ncbi:MAG: hypothetical protein WCP99_21970, partial [Burkholderiales bacterium]
MAGFNLKSIVQVQSADVSIKDIDGNATGVVFTMAGPEHPDRKRIAFAEARKSIARYRKSGRVELADPEDAEATRHENLAAYTLGWSGFVDDGGVSVPFSKLAALDLYND